MRDRGVVTRSVAAAGLAALLLTGCDVITGDENYTPPSEPMTSSSMPSASTLPSGPVITPPSTSFSPAPQEFDHAAMQDSVHKVLTEYHRIEGLQRVACPRHRLVQKNTTFHCTATIKGTKKKVPIKVTTDQGDYKVGYPK